MTSSKPEDFAADLAALRDDWRALLDSADTAEIFQTHEWMSTWWEVFGRSSERELFIITIRDGGHLIGLAPSNHGTTLDGIATLTTR